MNDDLQFRPMSKGLGFHQSKDIKPSIATTSHNAVPPFKKPNPVNQATLFPNKTKVLANSAMSTTNSTMLKRSSTLAKTSLVNDNDVINEVQDVFTRTTREIPSLITRLFSWCIDILTLTVLIGLSSMLIFKLNNFSWDEPLLFLQKDFFWNLYLPLGVGFYLFYFMLFERVTGQTLGKLLLGIKVIKLNSENPPSLLQCFLRNFLNIVSFATLGLLTVYDVVNWSLGLKVVNVKK